MHWKKYVIQGILFYLAYIGESLHGFEAVFFIKSEPHNPGLDRLYNSLSGVFSLYTPSQICSEGWDFGVYFKPSGILYVSCT